MPAIVSYRPLFLFLFFSFSVAIVPCLPPTTPVLRSKQAAQLVHLHKRQHLFFQIITAPLPEKNSQRPAFLARKRWRPFTASLLPPLLSLLSFAPSASMSRACASLCAVLLLVATAHAATLSVPFGASVDPESLFLSVKLSEFSPPCTPRT